MIFISMKEWIDLEKINLNEDLAVWFGTKKKPKGSKQPKGPWVNICRKVDGKHPPCGRPDISITRVRRISILVVKIRFIR